jgi:hypothetical protein
MAIGIAAYKDTSPYSNTNLFDGKFLDLLNYKPFPAEPDDIYKPVGATYHRRPDLMSYDLYGTSDYWWVFMARNRNEIVDPIWDFTSGTTIFLPKRVTLSNVLGE